MSNVKVVSQSKYGVLNYDKVVLKVISGINGSNMNDKRFNFNLPNKSKKILVM